MLVLMAAGAVLGATNSVLQLGRYGPDIAARFGSSDWTMIIVWSALLIGWTLILGTISGIALGRRWYGNRDNVSDGISGRSMASSD